jgi:hypothetical protein
MLFIFGGWSGIYLLHTSQKPILRTKLICLEVNTKPTLVGTIVGQLLLFFITSRVGCFLFVYCWPHQVSISFWQKIDPSVINFIIKLVLSIMHKDQFSNTHLQNCWLYYLGGVGYRVYFILISVFSVLYHKHV